jgi:hypothetical protein
MRGIARAAAGIAAAGVLAAAAPLSVLANVSLIRVSVDPYHNSASQHHTELEPDTHSFGSTEVATFQVGRFFDGGASNIGYAVTTNNASTWTHGFLPGTTKYVNGPFARISDPAVAYDPKHNVWLISSLALNANVSGAAVLVNRSTNGGTTFGNPVTVTNPGRGLDKSWIGCDETAASPHYGNCYTEWDDNGNLNLVYMSTSTDGGVTWGTPKNTVDSFHGIGGQPVVQPNGTVVVPIANLNETAIESFVSTDGGGTWTAPVVISPTQDHAAGGSFRHGSLPSAVVDTGGTVYVAWESCTLEPNCTNNDVLLSTSTTGVSWSAAAIVPIDPMGSGIDHMIPGIGVDGATSGATAHLGIVYFTESATCTSNCTVSSGFIASTSGGTTWGTAVQLAGPINQTWLANTSQGRMVGDYNSTSFLNGKAYPVLASAKAPIGSTFKENMFAPGAGLAASGGTLALIAGSSSGSGASTAAAPATAR